MSFELLVSKLPPKLRPYAKAWSAFFALSTAAVADLSVSGNELRALVIEAGAVIVGLVVARIPNQD